MTRPGRSELGAAAVEMALVMPLLILILAGVADFGTAFWVRAQIHEAAAEGVAAAAREPSRPTVARTYAVEAAGTVALTIADARITCQNSGRRVTMSIEHQHDFIFIGLFGVGAVDVGSAMVSDVVSDISCVASP